MAREYMPRTPEEVERSINQVTDPELARQMAEIEKPIRNLVRDSELDKKLRKAKPLLDKEADRLASKVLKKEIFFSKPIQTIELSTKSRTTLFMHSCHMSNIETLDDLVSNTYSQLLRNKLMGKKLLNEVVSWLTAHGLKLKE